MIDTIFLDANISTNISYCAKIIRGGGLVAFPTETVYGLGADGFNSQAVAKIFAAKGRPADNPLILHIAEIEMVKELYSDIPDVFYTLADAFFPGALTIIYRKSDIIPDEVTANLDTVAVRMPDDPYALALIRSSGMPLAAPSANVSGKPSPTCAQHVLHDMNGKIDAILDGGNCKIGLESTVLSIVDTPTILRPGGVTKEMLEAIIGKVKVADAVLSPLKDGESASSPGMKYKHYAPNAQVYAVYGTTDQLISKTIDAYDKFEIQGKKSLILASTETASFYGLRQVFVLGSRKNPKSFCNSIFAALRNCDRFDCVLCETLPNDGYGLAYMNRLLRACGFMTI